MDWLFEYPELIPGRLIQRYKRFLADIELEDGARVTAHCANPGRMTSCCEEDGRVWLSRAANPKRRLAFTWELSQMPTGLVMVNPLRANAAARAAIAGGLIPELSGYDEIASEVCTAGGSRLDFRLGCDCWVEVKSCTLVENGLAQFPDAPSARAGRHLDELVAAVKNGQRGVMLYLIGRGDAERFAPAAQIDPAYAVKLKTALAAGVEALAYSLEVKNEGVRLASSLALAL